MTDFKSTSEKLLMSWKLYTLMIWSRTSCSVQPWVSLKYSIAAGSQISFLIIRNKRTNVPDSFRWILSPRKGD